jgi:hypothetical protein
MRDYRCDITVGLGLFRQGLGPAQGCWTPQPTLNKL